MNTDNMIEKISLNNCRLEIWPRGFIEQNVHIINCKILNNCTGSVRYMVRANSIESAFDEAKALGWIK